MNTKKILYLVDDDEDDRQLFMDALFRINDEYEVQEFTNGVELMANLTDRFLQRLPDIIFLDLRMPLMNGFECLNDIKNISKLRDIPIVIYSNWYKETEVTKLGKKGANLLLVKPPSFTLLQNLLKEVFSKLSQLSTNKPDQFDIIEYN